MSNVQCVRLAAGRSTHSTQQHHWPMARLRPKIWQVPEVLQPFHRGLYGSCCISMGQVNGRGRFSTPTAPRSLNRFSLNLKYITTSRTRPQMQNFRGLCGRGWSGQIASLTHKSFCPFFSFLHHEHKSHLWTHPHAQYAIMHRSCQGSAFWGLERWTLKFDPPTSYPPKT